jgi:hypothetical protein
MAGYVAVALHHARVTDELGEGLVVGPAGELNHAGTLKARAITGLGVAQIATPLIGATIGQFLQPTQATGFMGDLGQKVANSGWGVDFEAVQTGIEIRQLLGADRATEEGLRLGGVDQVLLGWSLGRRAEANREVLQRFWRNLLLQPGPGLDLVRQAFAVPHGIRELNGFHGLIDRLPCSSSAIYPHQGQ